MKKLKGGNIKLKPCPFCGGNPELTECMGEVWYACEKCCASVSMATSKKEAARVWNKRYEPKKGVIKRLEIHENKIRGTK